MPSNNVEQVLVILSVINNMPPAVSLSLSDYNLESSFLFQERTAGAELFSAFVGLVGSLALLSPLWRSAFFLAIRLACWLYRVLHGLCQQRNAFL